MNLEQWEDMLGKADEWYAQDMLKADSKYVDDITGLPLDAPDVRKLEVLI